MNDDQAIYVSQGESSHHEEELHGDDNNEINQRIKEELALSAIHQKQVDSHWRQVLRKEKFQELHNDIGTLQHQHQRNIQQKKHLLNSIQNETNILQRLFHGAMVENINHLDRMITLHNEQVVLLKQDFRTRLASMQKEYHDNVETITIQYNKEKEVVQQCINRHEEKEQRRNELQQLDHQKELDEIESRHGVNNANTNRHLDSMVKHFQEEFEKMHEEYSQRNHVTRKVYEELKRKDEEVKKRIRQTTRKADHIHNKVQRVQLLAEKERVQRQDKHRALIERKARALETFQLVKDEMTNFRDTQQEKLVALSRRANARKESLEKQCVVAERVKKIAERCRQLETSREQFATILRQLSLAGNESNQEESSCVNDEASKLVTEQKKAALKSITIASSEPNERTLLWDTTHRFWDKYNVAQVHVLTIQKRIDELKHKETDLQRKITTCQNGFTVNDDVLKERNPLLVINGKMNASVPEKPVKRLTVLEGNHILASKLLFTDKMHCHAPIS